MARAIPMFPLGTTVLPGAIMPLQVFEPRYVEMVRDLLAVDDPPEFGTVLIERGHEVGGGDDRSDVGTLIRIADMNVTPDGRYMIAGVGVDRIRVERWLADDPYPRAEVEAWPDEPPSVDADSVERLVAHVTAKAVQLADLVRAAGHEFADVADGLADDPTITVYQLSTRSPIGPADRFRILVAPELAERCRALDAALDDAMAVIEFHRS